MTSSRPVRTNFPEAWYAPSAKLADFQCTIRICPYADIIIISAQLSPSFWTRVNEKISFAWRLKPKLENSRSRRNWYRVVRWANKILITNIWLRMNVHRTSAYTRNHYEKWLRTNIHRTRTYTPTHAHIMREQERKINGRRTLICNRGIAQAISGFYKEPIKM